MANVVISKHQRLADGTFVTTCPHCASAVHFVYKQLKMGRPSKEGVSKVTLPCPECSGIICFGYI